MTSLMRVVAGGVLWIGFALARVTDLRGETWAHALLLFAVLVLVPLALELFRDADEGPTTARWFFWLGWVQLPAGLLLAVACWLEPGPGAGLAALPWVGMTGLMAAIGLRRMRFGGMRRELDGQCRDVGLIYAAIGGIWVLADRSGFRPLGFSPDIVTLTAVHFHYAGFLLPLMAGLAQRELFVLRLASRAAVGVVLGVPAVAFGITATQLGWGPSVETAAGCGLALAGMAVGILHVRIGMDGRQSPLTRGLFMVAGSSLFVAMVFAAAYALRGALTLAPGLGIPQMRMLHGTLNALGFGLCGLLAWRRLSRE